MSTSAIVDAFSELGHAEQKKEISRRKKQYLAGKSKAVPWTQVKERLLQGDAR